MLLSFYEDNLRKIESKTSLFGNGNVAHRQKKMMVVEVVVAEVAVVVDVDVVFVIGFMVVVVVVVDGSYL